MSKKAEMLIEIEVDDNGSHKIKKLGDNIDTTSKKGEAGFGSMDKSLGGFTATASSALPVIGQIATVAGVATTALTAMVIQAASANRELRSFATMANTSAGDLAAYAYATKQVGIPLENLADISKDVKDKLGDFIATGGGEFKDFFINIGDQVGLTAQALQGLSGPDVLIAVKKAMDDANVSAEEQVFYLEAIGNDASRLIPLLENEGRAFKEQAAEAKALGIALSEIDSSNLVAAAEASSKFTTAFEGLYNRVAAKLAPYVSATMNAVADAIGNLNERLDDNNNPLIQAEESVGRLQTMANNFAVNAEVTGYWKDWEKVNAQLLKAQEHLRNLQEHQGLIAISSVDKRYAGGKSSTNSATSLNKRVDTELGGFFKNLDKNSGSLESYFTADSKTDGGKNTRAQAKAIPTLRAETLKVDKTAEVLAAYQSTFRQVEHVSQTMYDTLMQQYKTDKDAFIELTGDKQTAQEVYADRMDELNEKMMTSADETNNANAKKAAETAKYMTDAFSGWASNMSSELNDVLWGAEFTFGSMGESFGKMITQMILQKSLLEPTMTGLFGTGDSGGGLLSGLFNWLLPSAQGNVFAGNAAGISAYSNSIVSQPTIFPFAKGVGLMGEAGSEAIMPLTRMPGGDLGVRSAGGGGNVYLEIHNYSGEKATATTKTMPNGGKQITVAIGMMKTAISSGALDSTMKQNYGVTRRAY